MPTMILVFLKDIFASRSLIWELAKRDYKQQNQGSYLGVVWNILQPLLFVGVLYLIFTLGFKRGVESETPFGLYLVSGIVCWLYFVANLSSMSKVINSYSFLVKKVDFRLSILPIVKLISSLMPHLVLTGFAISTAIYQGWTPSWHLLQLPYYMGCMMLLLLGIGWLTASTCLFIKDVANVVAVITQFGFWLTPIFWHIEHMPERIQWVLKANPVYYLVTGYRDSILSTRWVWERPYETILFWAVTLFFVCVGAIVFKKLRPHFAEVI